ncbi:3-hydroxyacyl-ACP dehydratase FabZ family protein [uncultured Selenomonas sp.]|uniref:3-hydroxyacyl-ACP dehydratase FabZ family protein n=1 Tax=uncultured Selenomonas sp. TaxID=159275 RepID=UPI0025E57A2E|nr:3-hydroxyacyl-ACP dehydratase FabZ family protein [uncultured Selenomonas sp.]
MDKITNLGAYDIQQYQQNRYPVFFVDRILEVVPGKSAKGYKNFTYNEWFFPAHFHNEPNAPGFIQIECLTQVFLMTFLTIPEYKGMKTGFVSLKNVRFWKKIVPGDRLEMEAELQSFKRGLAKGKITGCVDGEIACQAEMEIAIPEVMKAFRPRQRTNRQE